MCDKTKATEILIKIRFSFAALAGAFFFGAVSAEAATFTVKTVANTGADSLAQAISGANAAPGDDIIVFDIPGAGPHVIELTAALPVVSGNLFFNNGSGGSLGGGGTTNVESVTVQRSMAVGTPQFRILTISNGTATGPTVIMEGLSLSNGLTHGVAPNDRGAAIYNDRGTLFITACTLSNNEATTGGAIYSEGFEGAANVGLTNCTLANNIATTEGGAIYNHVGVLRLLNCTISNNSAPVGGGIVNSATGGGASTRLGNTLLQTGPSGANLHNISGTFISDGNNLSNDAAGGAGGPDPDGFLSGSNDKRNTDPKLDPAGVQDNGGTTKTVALLTGSPAINAGNTAIAPTLDQRGYERSGLSDIGAFEFGGTAPAPTPLPQLVTRMRFIPPVVAETETNPVRFEATVSGSSSVVFNYDNVDRTMFDDGTHGDLAPGDGIWTILFSPAEILSKNTPARVFRPFLGQVKPNGGSPVNVIAEVWTSEIGLRDVHPNDAGGQETDYVANYVATGSQLQIFDPKQWTGRFYETHVDNFDFLNLVLVGGRLGNRTHTIVRNSVQGIGLAELNETEDYGSGGYLQGVNTFPVSSLFDGGEAGFIHETGHQWMNYCAGMHFESGIPHWPKGDIAINVMGITLSGAGSPPGPYNFTFTPNGSGGYSVGAGNPINQTTFNTMELYLMGLIPPGEVATFFVLNDQKQNVTAGQVLQPSEVTTVTVDHVIATLGPRVPDSTQAQKNFRSATIVLSDQLLDTHAMAFYDYFARRAEEKQQLPFASGVVTGTCNPWFLATGNRSEMVSKIPGGPVPSPTPIPTSLANISTRLRIETGDNALFAGFIVTGTQLKKVMVRAIGPSLTIPGKLENPRLELYNEFGQILQENDDWQDSTNKQEIIDSTIAPSHELESAIIATLQANNASYTAIVRGVNDTTGIGLLETYDLDRAAKSKLANISTRGVVQVGDDVLIAGLIVLGQEDLKVIVRAIGPSLSVAGKLEDPTLELRNGNGDLLMSNDNWRIGGQEAEIMATGIPPTNDAESAIVFTLPAAGASYTAIVRGVGDTTGIAVVEVYALN